jgi:hypothetical protein
VTHRASRVEFSIRTFSLFRRELVSSGSGWTIGRAQKILATDRFRNRWLFYLDLKPCPRMPSNLDIVICRFSQ